jgi:hypothetical protein
VLAIAILLGSRPTECANCNISDWEVVLEPVGTPAELVLEAELARLRSRRLAIALVVSAWLSLFLWPYLQ